MSQEQATKANQTLKDLSYLLSQKLISREQVLAIVNETQIPTSQPDKESKINIQKVLYYIGGFIILLGIVFFIYQFWEDMAQFTKVLVSLGSAASAYSLGYYFYKRNHLDFGHSFFIISAALFPLGIGTTLDMAGISATTYSGFSIISAVIFIVFFSSYVSLRTKVFLPFAILAGSSFYIALTNLFFGVGTGFENIDLYRALILGLSYVFLGFYFSDKYERFLTGPLYVFGLFFSLGAVVGLQGFTPNENFFWLGASPLLLVLVFYLSTKLQSKAFLLIATFFTFVQILKLTGEYFSRSVGWPVSLVIAGLLIMGIGYMSFEVNKKFLKKEASSKPIN